ncbi:hypothetical protein JET18_02980 [Chryseobacterium sp. L7]|uniref:Uncharacterized protein n=1 Tax=Chryseobacterium endalhagicum TaxID=2797638 RepID=A0ABS1QBW5_9FLAO|nr:hypothetical protein [Chryseobacterium endalhagicum]MBL1219782.1 hypothetical protein [Chryseobacterium endalhagicum]
MKKTALLLSVLAGVLSFAQSSPLIIQNYNTFDAIGRLRTGMPGGAPGPYMYAAPNAPYGTYTVPAGAMTQYNTFSTSNAAALPITLWYVTDPTNPANSGTYPPGHPFISSVMNPSNVWGGFHFWLTDPSLGVTDMYELGDPTVYSGFSTSGTGVFSSADWFTITTPSGPTTYLQIF